MTLSLVPKTGRLKHSFRRFFYLDGTGRSGKCRRRNFQPPDCLLVACIKHREEATQSIWLPPLGFSKYHPDGPAVGHALAFKTIRQWGRCRIACVQNKDTQSLASAPSQSPPRGPRFDWKYPWQPHGADGKLLADKQGMFEMASILDQVRGLYEDDDPVAHRFPYGLLVCWSSTSEQFCL
jgi:hypothetical protein